MRKITANHIRDCIMSVATEERFIEFTIEERYQMMAEKLNEMLDGN